MRGLTWALYVVAVAVPFLGLATRAQAGAGITERVSVASDGTQGNGDSQFCAMSADGRFVAFRSYADNLVPGDTNGFPDIFVHDRVTGRTERVSVAWDGSQANNRSDHWPSISADGRFVAFVSIATNLVPGATNGLSHVFVRDRLTRVTERVSVASDGTEANRGTYYRPAISADGQFVAFFSAASNLVPGDRNDSSDVFVRDRLTHTTERISVSTAGTEADGESWCPSISADGRFVTFYSEASNLVPGDTNGCGDIFVRDRIARTTERVSVSSAGEQANSWSFDWAPISADGRFVAFYSWANNLVPGDTNGCHDVFVRDRHGGTTERISLSSAGTQGNDNSFFPAMSADGRFVTFASFASNLVPGDTSGTADTILRDRQTGRTDCLSVSMAGTPGGGGFPTISADGMLVAFESGASNLVADDTNGVGDIFVRDRGSQGEWGALGGVVYRDMNANGIYDAGDSPIANASLELNTGETATSTNDGTYQFPSVRAGSGYILTASAPSYETKTIYHISIANGATTTLDIAMTPAPPREYKVEPLAPDPNPEASHVEEGGDLYRYYVVVDKATGKPAPSGIPLTIKSDLGVVLTASTDASGVVALKIPSHRIGAPGSHATFTTIQVNGVTIPRDRQIRFLCGVKERRLTTGWEIDASGGASADVGLPVGLANDAGVVSRVDLEGRDDESVREERQVINRQMTVAAGPEAGAELGIGLQLQGLAVGPYGSASAGPFLGVIGEDRYGFAAPSGAPLDSANKLYLVLGPLQKVNVLKNPLVNNPVVSPGVVNLTASLASLLTGDEARYPWEYTGLGGVLFGQGELRGQVGEPLYSDLPYGYFSIAGSAGLEGGMGALIGYYPKQANLTSEILVRFGLSLEGGAALYAAVIPQLMSDPLARELVARGGLSAISDTAAAEASLSSEVGFLTRDALLQSVTLKFAIRGPNWILNLLSSELDDGLTGEEVYVYSVHDRGSLQGVVDVATGGNPYLTAMKNAGTGSGTLVFSPELFASALKAPAFYSQFPRIIVHYERRKRILEPVPGDIDFFLGAGLVKAGFSLSLEQGVFYTTEITRERGVLIDGRFYTLEKYPDIAAPIRLANRPATLDDLLQEWATQCQDEIAGAFGQVQQQVQQGADTVVQAGNATVTYAQGAIQSGIAQVGAWFWGWAAPNPQVMMSDLHPAERTTREAARAAAQAEQGNLDYGIGGFYELTPEELVLQAPATISIAYADEEVAGLDETCLAVYRWDQVAGRWAYIGGMVDALDNIVTATIVRNGVYTLAPVVPDGDIVLHPNPATLPSDGASVSTITSDIIYNNDGTVVPDGTLFTVSATNGTILSADADGTVEGVQVASVLGVIQFDLRAPDVAIPADVTVRAVVGYAQGFTQIPFWDNVAPEAPTNVAAGPGESRIQVTWQASPSPDVKGYKLYYRAGQAGPPYDGRASIYGVDSPVVLGNVLEGMLTGLTVGAQYHIAVTAYDYAGNESAYSSEAVVMTADMAPVPPASLAAVDTPLDNGNSITVTWTLSPDDGVGSGDVQGYVLERKAQGEVDWQLLATVPAGCSRYVDNPTNSASPPQNGVEYYYRIAATDTAGHLSARIEAGPAVAAVNFVAICGQVCVRGTTSGVPDAAVRAYLSGELAGSAVTDASGMYYLCDLPAGGYVVGASKPGYITQTKAQIGVTPGVTAYVNFGLEASGRIMGQVRVRGTTTFVPGAAVAAYLAGKAQASATTDTIGMYAIDSELPAGTYAVAAGKAGYVTQVKAPVTVASGQTSYVNFGLELSGRLMGQVKDRGQNAVLPGASVSIYSGGKLCAVVTTGADGIFVAESNLPAGIYVLIASKSGYVNQTKAKISVTGGQTTYVNFNLDKVCLMGQVRQAGTTTDLAGATVAAYLGSATTPSATATTDANGIYQIGGLSSGTYTVVASDTGYVKQIKPGISFTEGTITYVNFNLQVSGRLKGQVTNKLTGAPIIGATVIARSGGILWATAITVGPWGIYEINSDLPAGTFVTQASAPGYAALGRNNIAVSAGATTYVNFPLQPQ